MNDSVLNKDVKLICHECETKKIILVPDKDFEPQTLRLPVRYSTTELEENSWRGGPLKYP